MTYFQNPNFKTTKDQNNSLSIEVRHSFKPRTDQEPSTQKQFAQTTKNKFYQGGKDNFIINNLEPKEELQVQMLDLDKILSENESQGSNSLMPFQNVIDIEDTNFEEIKQQKKTILNREKEDMTLNFKEDRIIYAGDSSSIGDSVLGLLEDKSQRQSIRKSRKTQQFNEKNQILLQNNEFQQFKSSQSPKAILEGQNLPNSKVTIPNKMNQKQAFSTQQQFFQTTQTSGTLSSTATSTKGNLLTFKRPANPFSTALNFHPVQKSNSPAIKTKFRQNFKLEDKNYQRNSDYNQVEQMKAQNKFLENKQSQSNNKQQIKQAQAYKQQPKQAQFQQFQAQKFNNQQQQKIQQYQQQILPTTKAHDDNLEIFCVDCEEYIRIQDVERHAETCFKILNKKKNQQQVKNKPVLTDINEVIFQCNLKLEKVVSLIVLKLELFEKYSAGNVYIKQVIDIGNQLQNLLYNMIQTNQNQELLKQYLMNAEKLNGKLSLLSNKVTNQQKQSFIHKKEAVMLQILIFRALNLAKEKNQALISIMNNPSGYYQSNEIQSQIELWKEQCHMLKNLADTEKGSITGKYQINNIVSDYAHSSQSSANSEKTDNTQFTQGFAKACQVLSQTNWGQKENMRREFYAEVICFKLTLPENQLKNNVLISDLFQECVKREIPKNQWKDFITGKLQG